MNKYFSIFIPGLKDVVEKALKEMVTDVKVVKLKDGLIVYESSECPAKIAELPFFNNSFVLIKAGEKEEGFDFGGQLKWAQNSDDFFQEIRGYAGGKVLNFRVVLSRANRMVSEFKDQVVDVENLIIKRCKLNLDKSFPDVEIWFMERAEGKGFVGIRLTSRSTVPVEKGELRPQLAYLMNYISEPSGEDVFLDPFCGSGVIPISRALHFPYKRIIASDVKLDAINEKIMKTDAKLEDFEVMKMNAFQLPEIDARSIDKIVTDPPWGEARPVDDLRSFYLGVLRKLNEVLVNGGIAVILTSQKELVDGLLSGHKLFKVKKTWDILVSGFKARIYRLEKI